MSKFDFNSLHFFLRLEYVNNANGTWYVTLMKICCCISFRLHEVLCLYLESIIYTPPASKNVLKMLTT